MHTKVVSIVALTLALQACAALPTDTEVRRFTHVPTATSVAFSECGRFAMLQDETGFVAAIASLETGDMFRPDTWPREHVIPWQTLRERYAWTSVASAPVALRRAEQDHLWWLTRRRTRDASCAMPTPDALASMDAATRLYSDMRIRVATLRLNDVPMRFELVVTLHFVTLALVDAGDEEGEVRFAAPVIEHAFSDRVTTPTTPTTPLKGRVAWLERDGDDVVLRDV